MTTHSIADKHGKQLLPRTGWGTERLAGLLNVLEEQLDAYNQAVMQAGQVSSDLKDHARSRKQQEILKKARRSYQAKIDEAMQQIRGGLEAAKANLQEKTAPKQPDSSIDRLYDLMLKQEIRQEIREVNSNERIGLIRESVRNGDRTLLDAVRGPVKPLIDPIMISGLEETYHRAVASNEVDQVQLESEVISQAEGVLKNAERHLKHLEGQEERLVTPAEPEPAFDGWNAKRKADFIKKHGQDAYLKVANGEAYLEDFQEAS